MKTEEEIKQEITNLLPYLDDEKHGCGNASYSSFTQVRGQVESLLWVLGMDGRMVDEETAQEDIKRALQ